MNYMGTQGIRSGFSLGQMQTRSEDDLREIVSIGLLV